MDVFLSFAYTHTSQFTSPILDQVLCCGFKSNTLLCLRTRKHWLNLLHYLMCIHKLYVNYRTNLRGCSVIATVHSAKFCRCHHGIMIYRHACQDQDSLSSSMAIAKHVAKTCGWGWVSPCQLSEKTLLERHCECLCVYTCPILLPFHSKWLFIMAGMELTASTYLSNSTAFTGAQDKLQPQFRWNKPYEGTTFGWQIGL